MIEQVISPITHDLGQFEFVDQFGPAQLDLGTGMDVRPHPHINLATVTWLFEGAIEHRDSLGSFSTIRPGQVNLMTAGKGIVHSERFPQAERDLGPKLYGMQTWLALPDGREEIDPAFEAITDLPVVEDRGVKAFVIMGELWGKRAATTTYADTIYAEILLEPGGSLPIEISADERAVMLVGGEASVDSQPLGLYQLTVLAPGRNMTLSSDRGGRIMLLGGEAFTTPRHAWWNFVSSDKERIHQAKEDWEAGRFPKVPGDEEEWIPIPETPNTSTE